MNRDVDVIVAGGGPVGLAAAIEARMAGLSVVIVEPRGGAIDKACGEGLMPGAVAALRRLGVEPPGREFMGIRYLSGSRAVAHRFRHGPGIGSRRLALHAALADRARELDVSTVVGRVDQIRQDPLGVWAGGLRAGFLLGCDGLHSTVAREAGLALPTRGSKRFGIRRHFTIEPWSEYVDVHWTRDAEIYITPVAENTVGIAVLGPRGTDFSRAVSAVPELTDRLRGAIASSSQRGAGPLRQTTSARTSGRVLLVGDASGYVDAITGEGIRVGLAQARAAIQAVVAGDSHRYERSWSIVTRDFRMLTGGLVGAASSPLRGGIVPLAASAPWLYGAVVERLAR